MRCTCTVQRPVEMLSPRGVTRSPQAAVSAEGGVVSRMTKAVSPSRAACRSRAAQRGLMGRLVDGGASAIRAKAPDSAMLSAAQSASLRTSVRITQTSPRGVNQSGAWRVPAPSMMPTRSPRERVC